MNICDSWSTCCLSNCFKRNPLNILTVLKKVGRQFLEIFSRTCNRFIHNVISLDIVTNQTTCLTSRYIWFHVPYLSHFHLHWVCPCYPSTIFKHKHVWRGYSIACFVSPWELLKGGGEWPFQFEVLFHAYCQL